MLRLFMKHVHASSIAALLPVSLILSGCVPAIEDPQFEADYVDDYESDLKEDAAQEAEQNALDQLDDLDEIPTDLNFTSLRAQSIPLPHGPLSILEDINHFSGPDTAQHFDDASALGADVVRVLLAWKDVVPGNAESTAKPNFNATDPNQYVEWDENGHPRLDAQGQKISKWTKYDTLVQEARRRGLRVLITISSPMPFWASEESFYCVKKQDEDQLQPQDDRHVWSCGWKPNAREYAKFVTAVGRHFRNQGVWGVTLWNEPNHPAFLLDGQILQGAGSEPLKIRSPMYLIAMRYRKLWFVGRKALRQTARMTTRVFFSDMANGLIAPDDKEKLCMKNCDKAPADPDYPGPAKCTACGNADDDPQSVRWKFFRYALCLDPADGELLEDRMLAKCPEAPRRVWTSGIAFHPYSPSPSVLKRSVEIMTGLVDDAAKERRLPANRGIYLTEHAYLTQKGEAGLGASAPVTLQQQAEYNNITDRYMYENRRVKTIAQYELYDDGTSKWECGLRYSDRTNAADAYWENIAKQNGISLDMARALRGQPKLAYNAYRMSIDVVRKGSGMVDVFGLVRPAAQTTIPLQGQIPLGWVPVGGLTIDAFGFGKTTIPVGMATAFRLSLPMYQSREVVPRTE